MENKELYKKVFELKKHIGKISKDSENPFHNSKYFDINKLLEVVEPLLQKENILLMQPIINGVVVTQLIDLENDAILESGIELPQLTDPQKIGSCVTYYRRYALKSMLGIQEEDDDGNKATKQPIKKAQPTEPTEIYQMTVKDVEKWNGKIYGKNTVYVNGEKKHISEEQITKLKAHANYKPDNK